MFPINFKIEIPKRRSANNSKFDPLPTGASKIIIGRRNMKRKKHVYPPHETKPHAVPVSKCGYKRVKFTKRKKGVTSVSL
jgi:hypothetical protein